MEYQLEKQIAQQNLGQPVQNAMVEDAPETLATEMKDVLTTSLHLRGVDTLSTTQVKEYLDLHIRPGFCFETRQRFAYLDFKINWINDSELNIVFNYKQNTKISIDEKCNVPADIKEENEQIETDAEVENIKELKYDSSKGALDAIMLLTDFDNIRSEHVEFSQLPIEDQFAAVDQAPKLEERKCWDLVLDLNNKVVKTKAAKTFYKTFQEAVLGENVEDDQESPASDEKEEFPEDFRVIHLEVRFSTKKDTKVKNAREFSRYYLLNGEPELTERVAAAQERYDVDYANRSTSQKDLITGRAPETQGLFGYDGDREFDEVNDRDNYKKTTNGISGRWKNDYYFADRQFRSKGRNWSRGRAMGRERSGHGFSSGGIYKKPQTSDRSSRPRAVELPDLFPDFGKK